MEKRLILFWGLFTGFFAPFLSSASAQIDTGTFIGTMHLKPKTIGLDSIGVKLQIEKLSDTLYQWRMSYSNSIEKNYRMIVKEGRYLLDEQNGILLPGAMEGGRLSFRYTVDDILYEVEYDLNVAGVILFDLRYYRKGEAIQIEKNQIQGYILSGNQYARMEKAD